MGNGGDRRNLAAAWGGERGSRKTREMGSNVGVCARGLGVCASWVGPEAVWVVGGCVPGAALRYVWLFSLSSAFGHFAVR